MCIAVPARVVSIAGLTAVVERYGQELTVSLAMLGEDVAVGDYLIIQAERYATQRIDAATAEEAYKLFESFGFGGTHGDQSGSGQA